MKTLRVKPINDDFFDYEVVEVSHRWPKVGTKFTKNDLNVLNQNGEWKVEIVS